MPESVLHSTTQTFLDIFDITNNMVVLKDGTTSIIIQVDAMNFGLLAEEEQDSIMYAYAGLLNSLNYPIQIVIRSQTKDVTSYLGVLKEQEETAGSQQIQQRIRKYREFVSNLIKERNVLDKKFYVTISATPLELGLFAPQSFVPGKSKIQITPEQRPVVLEKARNLLEPKRDHLVAQFARIGLFARQLTTQEIIQFFYLSYNPEASEGQQIADTSNYTTPLVVAGIEGNTTMNDASTVSPLAQPQVTPEQLAPQAPTPVQPIEPAPVVSAQTQVTQNQPAYTPTQMGNSPAQPEPVAPAVVPPTPAQSVPPEPVTPIMHAAPAQAPVAETPVAVAPNTDTQIAPPTPPAPSVPQSAPASIPTPVAPTLPVAPTTPAQPPQTEQQPAGDNSLEQLQTLIDQTAAQAETQPSTNTTTASSDSLPPLPEI